jgi:hypothetical protein
MLQLYHFFAFLTIFSCLKNDLRNKSAAYVTALLCGKITMVLHLLVSADSHALTIYNNKVGLSVSSILTATDFSMLQLYRVFLHNNFNIELREIVH